MGGSKNRQGALTAFLTAANDYFRNIDLKGEDSISAKFKEADLTT